MTYYDAFMDYISWTIMHFIGNHRYQLILKSTGIIMYTLLDAAVNIIIQHSASYFPVRRRKKNSNEPLEILHRSTIPLLIL